MKLTREEAERTLRAVAAAKARVGDRPGQKWSPNGWLTIAARTLDIPASSLESRLKEFGSVERAMAQPPGEERVILEMAEPPPSSIIKPRIRVKAGSDSSPDGPIYTILAIGDHHDKPGRDKTRATWIGRLAAEKRPDYIVSIGDWASLDSLSSHEVPGSAKHAEMSSFPDDIDSLEESLMAFHKDLPVGSIPIFQTHGNHEHRAARAANNSPKSCCDLPLRLDQTFARYRWNTVEFGKFLTLGQVDFVHVPLSIMGREFGGEHIERTVGNKALRSIVFGHTHRRGMFSQPKVGQNRKITALNLGTSMPWGMTEPYNKVSTSGWSYGIFWLRVQNGQILSEKFFDMIEMQELFG